MADYNTHFSCLFDVGTPKNAVRALDLYTQISVDGVMEDPPSDGFALSIEPEHGAPDSGCAMTSPAIRNL